ncbi:MAG TPA: nitroreductase family protein [Acidimicrobiales bacterium]
MTEADDIDRVAADLLLTTTRSVRRRLDLTRPVPREVLLECIGIAEQAPVGSNEVSRWHWLVVDDPDLKAQVAAVYQEAWAPYTARFDPSRLDERAQRTMAAAAFVADHMAEVPALVIPCVRRHRSSTDPAVAMPHPAAVSVYGSIFPSIWSFCLALRTRGLGSSITTMHLHGANRVAALLGVPDTFLQACLLPVGYYTGETFRPVPRPDPATITGFNGWA